MEIVQLAITNGIFQTEEKGVNRESTERSKKAATLLLPPSLCEKHCPMKFIAGLDHLEATASCSQHGTGIDKQLQ